MFSLSNVELKELKAKLAASPWSSGSGPLSRLIGCDDECDDDWLSSLSSSSPFPRELSTQTTPESPPSKQDTKPVNILENRYVGRFLTSKPSRRASDTEVRTVPILPSMTQIRRNSADSPSEKATKSVNVRQHHRFLNRSISRRASDKEVSSKKASSQNNVLEGNSGVQRALLEANAEKDCESTSPKERRRTWSGTPACPSEEMQGSLLPASPRNRNRFVSTHSPKSPVSPLSLRYKPPISPKTPVSPLPPTSVQTMEGVHGLERSTPESSKGVKRNEADCRHVLGLDLGSSSSCETADDTLCRPVPLLIPPRNVLEDQSVYMQFEAPAAFENSEEPNKRAYGNDKVAAGTGYTAVRALKPGAACGKADDLSMLTGDWMLRGEKIATIMDAVLTWSAEDSEILLSRQGDDVVMDVDGVQYLGNLGLAQGEIHWSDGDVWQKKGSANDVAEVHEPGALETPPTDCLSFQDTRSSETPPRSLTPCDQEDKLEDEYETSIPQSAQLDTTNHWRQARTERDIALHAVPLMPAASPASVMMAHIEGDWYSINGGEFRAAISEGGLTWKDGSVTALFWQGSSVIMELDGECYHGQLSMQDRHLVWSDGDTWECRSDEVKLHLPVSSTRISDYMSEQHAETYQASPRSFIQDLQQPLSTQCQDARTREELLLELAWSKERVKELQKREREWRTEKQYLKKTSQELRAQIAYEC